MQCRNFPSSDPAWVSGCIQYRSQLCMTGACLTNRTCINRQWMISVRLLCKQFCFIPFTRDSIFAIPAGSHTKKPRELLKGYALLLNTSVEYCVASQMCLDAHLFGVICKPLGVDDHRQLHIYWLHDSQTYKQLPYTWQESTTPWEHSAKPSGLFPEFVARLATSCH